MAWTAGWPSASVGPVHSATSSIRWPTSCCWWRCSWCSPGWGWCRAPGGRRGRARFPHRPGAAPFTIGWGPLRGRPIRQQGQYAAAAVVRAAGGDSRGVRAAATVLDALAIALRPSYSGFAYVRVFTCARAAGGPLARAATAPGRAAARSCPVRQLRAGANAVAVAHLLAASRRPGAPGLRSGRQWQDPFAAGGVCAPARAAAYLPLPRADGARRGRARRLGRCALAVSRRCRSVDGSREWERALFGLARREERGASVVFAAQRLPPRWRRAARPGVALRRWPHSLAPWTSPASDGAAAARAPARRRPAGGERALPAAAPAARHGQPVRVARGAGCGGAGGAATPDGAVHPRRTRAACLAAAVNTVNGRGRHRGNQVAPRYSLG